MKSSVSDDTNYVTICEKIAKEEFFFSNFKQNSIYNEILEHVSQKQGQDYLDIIKEEQPSLLDYIVKFKENDKYGNPRKFGYENLGELSPSTLRYIKVLNDLINNFDNLDNMEIIEIGAGYGGQSKIITDVFNIKKYDIIDLKYPLAITKKYLSLFDKISLYGFIDAYEFEKSDSDLLISNYAFSECSKNIQDEYIDKIINNSKHGYMSINYLNNTVYTVDELIERIDKDIKIIEEKPNTHKFNKILIW